MTSESAAIWGIVSVTVCACITFLGVLYLSQPGGLPLPKVRIVSTVREWFRKRRWGKTVVGPSLTTQMTALEVEVFLLRREVMELSQQLPKVRPKRKQKGIPRMIRIPEPYDDLQHMSSSEPGSYHKPRKTKRKQAKNTRVSHPRRAKS